MREMQTRLPLRHQVLFLTPQKDFSATPRSPLRHLQHPRGGELRPQISTGSTAIRPGNLLQKDTPVSHPSPGKPFWADDPPQGPVWGRDTHPRTPPPRDHSTMLKHEEYI